MSRKKTHEEYVDELMEIRPNIDVLEPYINNKAKILHKCNICGYEWRVRPDNILHGTGCPQCAGHQKRTHEDYVNTLRTKKLNIEVIGEYVNSQTKILHKCLICNHKWFGYPNNIIRGSGCPKCANKKIGEERRKSHNQYVDEVKEIAPEIEVVGKYKNAITHILHKCNVCGYEWNTTPNNILSGHKCPKCTHHITKSHQEYVKELSIINPNSEVIGQYIDSETLILHHCLIHDKYWNQSPYNALKGYGCDECKREKIGKRFRKTHDQYVKDVFEKNPNIEVIGEYINSKTPILHKCIIDGFEWNAQPSSILIGTGCPLCNESRGERKVRLWLERHGFYYIPQMAFDDCKDVLPMPYDFYLPEQNLCIEFDGQQHFEPVKFSKNTSDEESFEKFMTTILHDGMKNNYCKWNGIKLLRIPYFKDIEEELNNFLLN